MNQLIDFNKIKLVIWDLDDTFWKGTLSEGGVIPIENNISLVKALTDCGIVNAICSKNDEPPVMDMLKQMGVNDYFVFNSIDWTPKGERIKNLIIDMGLRPVNVLFVDDNIVNLNEARFYSDGLMIAEPIILNGLADFISRQPKKDLSHSRLNNYKTLEKKVISKKDFSDNLSFLYSTNTQVAISKDCLENISRLHELVLRTNQLNYTKNRMSIEELESLIKQDDIDCGYVTVRDKFGDYGIIGFFAIKNKKCIHFLFSCRAIGQGVEQWVYAKLGYPQLDVVGDVIQPLTNAPAPKWINQSVNSEYSNEQDIHEVSGKIIFKSGCDLSILVNYLNFKGDVVTEFTYVGETRHNEIEHHNHSVNFLSFPFLSSKERKELLDDCIFNDPNMFETHIYDNDLTLLVLSTLVETNLGVYQKKGSNLRVAFGEYTGNLTDREIWDNYLNGKQYGYLNNITSEWLTSFSEKYEYLGRLSPQDYVNNLKKLLEKISPKAHVCLILGSEIEYENNTQEAYNNRAEDHKLLNDAIKEFALSEPRLHLVEYTDFIHGQSDFTNNINHFKREVYYRCALRINDIVQEVTGQKMKVISPLKRWLQSLGQHYTNKINRNSWYYPIVRKVFHSMADKNDSSK